MTLAALSGVVYDIIFAGGGATACVTAGRLAATDPALKILIVEAGPHTLENPHHIQPARYFSNLSRLSGSRLGGGAEGKGEGERGGEGGGEKKGEKKLAVFSSHVGLPSRALNGRAPVVQSARAVGGGSGVNFMTYARGARSDYDDWESVYGNKGWGSEDLIPLLMKAETYQPALAVNPTTTGTLTNSTNSTNSTHGTSGPIKISLAPDALVNVAASFLEVARGYDTARAGVGVGVDGVDVSIDVNGGGDEDAQDFAACDRYARTARYIDGETGRRSDVAHHYIYNQASNENLTVLAGHKVVRVLFEGNKATGIEFIDDVINRDSAGLSQTPTSTTNTATTTTITAHASRLVVLSAGAFGSPAILERSGIGAKHILEKIGLEKERVVVDLPGVGEGYMDHNFMLVPNVATHDAYTLDDIFWGSEDEIKPYEDQWLKDCQGLMACNGTDAGVKLRPNKAEVAALSAEFPQFGEWWQTYFEPENHRDKPLALLGTFAAYAGSNPDVPRGKYFCIEYFLAYPASTGYVHVTSASNPYVQSDFHPGYLDNPADIASLRWCYKKARELSRRMRYYAGDVVVGHPKFREGSVARVMQNSQPVGVGEPDIVYSKEDDAAIDEYHREAVETTWHSIGTCSMKPRDKGGVVDERLNVYGVTGLKVADCSIAPANVGANMYNTAIAIGEKAAVIIAQDLGIPGVTEF